MHGAHYLKRPETVSFDSSEDGHSYDPPTRPLSRLLKARYIFLLSLGFVTATAIAVLYRSSSNLRHTVRITECGHTPDEAIARGCRFESHNFAWTPPDCYDQELDDLWNEKNWGYSRNAEGTDLLSKDEVLEGKLSWAYVTLNQHMSHCVLIWQKYQRAVMQDLPADNWTSSFPHTYHCGHMMVQWDLNHSEYNSILYTKYVSCNYDWKTLDRRMSDTLRGPMDGGLIGDGGDHASYAGGKPVEAGHEDMHHVQRR
ncbi:hypothetical protein LZ32DRAFT_622193 [Colletotrichum eremochloae]|nr:hypothetical protein LZ32DRAFT_622193 [Colletotrichum eremochloae]